MILFHWVTYKIPSRWVPGFQSNFVMSWAQGKFFFHVSKYAPSESSIDPLSSLLANVETDVSSVIGLVTAQMIHVEFMYQH